MAYPPSIQSDSAPVAETILELLNAGIEIHCLRDLTRGGLASALNEIAISANLEITINENSIFVKEEVKGACEILGFDPLYIANEGRFVAFVNPKYLAKTLKVLQNYYPEASLIGKVKKSPELSHGIVIMNSKIGATRIVDMLSGEQLPRIC